MMNQEEFENIMKGLALFKYLDTHKPDGKDIDGFTKDIVQYFSLLIEHYEYCIKTLLALREKTKEYEARGWYQKKRKKDTIKMIDSQIKDFEKEKMAISEMMSNL